MPLELSLIFGQVWQIIKVWWWVLIPFLFLKPFLYLWLWWRIDLWLKKHKFIILEIRLPKDVLKPIRAMEVVMASFHGAVYHPPDWWEKWIDGQIQTSISFEIVSIDGEPHFFIRFLPQYRDAIESAIFSQYPDAEIKEVDDYAKRVPQDIPNKDWDMFGSDYKLNRDDHYPIKTYTRFETEREAKEEKRIDPVANLLEAFGQIKPGEQLWIQIGAEPMAENPAETWKNKGEAMIEQIVREAPAKRLTKPAPKPIPQAAVESLISGKPPEALEGGEGPQAPALIELTFTERELIEAISTKISKPIFKSRIRFIYLGKTGVWFKPNFRLALSFFNDYTIANLNALYPWGETFTKIHKSWFLPLNLIRPRRHYLRCRKLFRNYLLRVNPLFPRRGGDKGLFVLNIEELASLFHFPGREVAPAPFVPRVEAKKGEAPPGLPTE